MACIVASFDTASLYSAMNCCTTVTTLTMLSRGKLFAVGASADYAISMESELLAGPRAWLSSICATLAIDCDISEGKIG
jgi:hypothetical protein